MLACSKQSGSVRQCLIAAHWVCPACLCKRAKQCRTGLAPNAATLKHGKRITYMYTSSAPSAGEPAAGRHAAAPFRRSVEPPLPSRRLPVPRVPLRLLFAAVRAACAAAHCRRPFGHDWPCPAHADMGGARCHAGAGGAIHACAANALARRRRAAGREGAGSHGRVLVESGGRGGARGVPCARAPLSRRR